MGSFSFVVYTVIEIPSLAAQFLVWHLVGLSCKQKKNNRLGRKRKERKGRENILSNVAFRVQLHVNNNHNFRISVVQVLLMGVIESRNSSWLSERGRERKVCSPEVLKVKELSPYISATNSISSHMWYLGLNNPDLSSLHFLSSSHFYSITFPSSNSFLFLSLHNLNILTENFTEHVEGQVAGLTTFLDF